VFVFTAETAEFVCICVKFLLHGVKRIHEQINDIIATPPVFRFAKGRIIIASSEGATV
jgi:hypothetical protein